MDEVRRKLAALLDSVQDRKVLVDLIIDVVVMGLESTIGQPRKRAGGNVKSDADGIKSDAPPTSNSMLLASNSTLSFLDLNSESDSDPSSKHLERLERDERPDPPGFGEFWYLYPKKVGKADAKRAWRRIRPPLMKVRATLAWQVKCEQWRKGYIPNPATWINQGRWEDEPPKTNGHAAAPVRYWKEPPPASPWPKGEK